MSSSALEAIESSTGDDLLCGRCCRKMTEGVSKLCVCGTPLHPSCSDDVAVRECELTYGFPEPSGFCSKRCYESDLLSQQSMVQQPMAQQSMVQQQQQQQQQLVVDSRMPAQLSLSHVDPNQLHLQQQQQQQQQQQPTPPKRILHVPNEIAAVLTVKIGDVGKTSRRHLSVSTFRFLLSEGFEVFKAKANSLTTKELQQHRAGVADTFVRDDRAIYIKPGVHSKQAELVQLTEKNFDARIERSFRNFLKRKSTTGGASAHSSNCSSDPTEFACDILTYVRKDTSRRRPAPGATGTSSGSKQPHASAVKSTSQLHSLMEYTDQQQHQALAMDAHLHASSAMTMSSASSGGATGDFAASLASVVSSNGHKRKHSQALLTDAPTTPALLDADGPGAYKTIRMVLNGAVVPVQVNVRDLLACFGLASNAGSGAPDDASVTIHDL